MTELSALPAQRTVPRPQPVFALPDDAKTGEETIKVRAVQPGARQLGKGFFASDFQKAPGRLWLGQTGLTLEQACGSQEGLQHLRTGGEGEEGSPASETEFFGVKR